MDRRNAAAVKFARFIGLLCACGFVCAGGVRAQLPSLKKPAEPKAAETPEKPEDARKRLEQWQKEAREALTRLDAANGNAAVPPGITPAEIEERRRDLEQLVLVTNNALRDIATADQARKALEKARAEDAAWSGFRETAPFSILLLDGLQNERDAILAKLRTHESALTNIQGLRTSTIGELKAAEDAANTAIAAVQNADAVVADAAKWRLEAARGKVRALAARAGYFQNVLEILNHRISSTKIELALVERKIGIAMPESVFSEEDLAKVEAATKERAKGFTKELTAVSKRLQSAVSTRDKAQSALDALLARPAEEQDPAQLELANFRLEVAESRVESLQSLNEALEGLILLENMAYKAYQDRRTILTTTDENERAKTLGSLTALSERYRAWLNVLNNEMATCGADLSKIESLAATIPAGDPRFDLLNEQRAARSEKLAMLQRVHQTVTSHRAIIRRWLGGFSAEEKEAPLLEKLGNYAAKGRDMVKKTWSLEVMSYEDKIEVDGETITGRIPVTLGMLLRALLFFVIGYAIAAHVAKRLQRMMVTRGHVAEAQARTLRNWAMIAVGVALALITLSFLKIPLTVFAFFGGALAIGLGFGMQTLIKNFISGIIVLVERKIRVGDILDVDGIIGSVVEVNTRSSIIRSADDVETMIPNSVFLENRVTNWTLSTSRMRRNLRVGVAYGTDPRMVMEILTDCAGRHGLVCKDPAPFAVFEDFGDNALIFMLYFWIELGKGANPMVVASDLRLMIDKRFSEAGIGVPFPQRDMHLTTHTPIQVQVTHE
jgi:small-conductance mechanosensitive channel